MIVEGGQTSLLLRESGLMVLSDNDLDEAAMAEADAALRALAEAYPDYAAAELDELCATLDKVTGGEDVNPETLYLPAHNLKGQGSAFGYDLITTLGDALCGILRGRTALTQSDQSIVAGLIAACRTVLSQRLTGDGGKAGIQLMRDLMLQPS